MLCSRCSEPVTPIVALDLDGTLGNYHAHFLRFAEQYLGIKGTPFGYTRYVGDESFSDWFTRIYSVGYRDYRDIKLAYRQGGMKRSMPMYTKADELVAGLHDGGAEVWITTTRPFLRLDQIDPDTREWLRRNNISYDGLLYDEDKYLVLANRVDPARVVAVLDDLAEQYDAAERVFGGNVPILRRNGFNDGTPRPNMIKTMDEALVQIATRLEIWRMEHNVSV